jgi:hypothetical protein
MGDKRPRLRVESHLDENAVSLIGHQSANYPPYPWPHLSTDFNDSSCTPEENDYRERRMSEPYVFVVLVGNVAAVPRGYMVKARINAKLRLARPQEVKKCPRRFPKIFLSFICAVHEYICVDHNVKEHG